MFDNPLVFREYFGEEVALYFAYLNFWVKFLTFPALLGVGIYVFDLYDGEAVNEFLAPAYTFVICMWATLLCERWKQEQARYRIEFHGLHGAHMRVYFDRDHE